MKKNRLVLILRTDTPTETYEHIKEHCRKHEIVVFGSIIDAADEEDLIEHIEETYDDRKDIS